MSDWTWIVASMPGVGDVAMEVQVSPEEIANGYSVADSFEARHLTHFMVTPDPKGGANIQLKRSFLAQIDATAGHVHVQASAIAWWAMASPSAVEKLAEMWSPIVKPRNGLAIVKGRGA